MKPEPTAPRGLPRRRRRGSALLSALLVATVVGIGLASYLRLTTRALQLSQRTFYLNDATSLAEAGIEEAVYAFGVMDAGTAVATAWSGWSLSGGNATFTLPTFNCSQNAIGVVKVYVSGYDGTLATPSVISQAVVTPLDGTRPIRKTLKIGLRKKGAYDNAIVTSSNLSLGSSATVDSFNSNPTGAANATRLEYPGNGASANGNLAALGGTISLGSHSTVNGNVMVASGVTAPSQSQVTGQIITNYSGSFPMPAFPVLANLTRGYFLLSIPATLPRTGDLPAADGRYYYFGLGLNIGSTTISAGKNVTVVGAFGTRVSSGLTVRDTGSLIVFMDGVISSTGSSPIVNEGWAGALQIFTATTQNCELAHSGRVKACIYAPFAKVTLNGGGSSPEYVGAIYAKTVTTSSNLALHYDEALQTSTSVVGIGNKVATWYDLSSSAELATISGLTGGFLQ